MAWLGHGVFTAWLAAIRTHAHDEILTAEQVAELLQLYIDHVRKLSREGTIPAHRLPAGRIFR